MTKPATEELFDAEFLGRLRALFFKLRKRRQLMKKGPQQTRAAGFTREFKDHRSYVSGDDYRTIDWRLFARLEKLFIRLYEEVQEFHVHILIDRSVSMREPHGDKRVSTLRLAVALTYLGLVSGHRVSLFSIGQDVRRELAPLKGPGNIHAVLAKLATLKFDAVTDLTASLRLFRPGRDRRGVVFILSDLFGAEPEESVGALKQANAWPAETHIVHILDPHELKPTETGELLLEDAETGEIRRLFMTKREVELYAENVATYLDAVERRCLESRVDYMTWSTALSFEELFLQLLSRGTALAQA